MPYAYKNLTSQFQSVVINEKGYKVVMPLFMPTMRS